MILKRRGRRLLHVKEMIARRVLYFAANLEFYCKTPFILKEVKEAILGFSQRA